MNRDAIKSDYPRFNAMAFAVGRFMKHLRAFLFGEPNGPLWRYCLVAFPIAFLPSTAIIVAVLLSLTAAGVDIAALAPPEKEQTAFRVFLTLILAPAIETLLLAGGLRVLSALSQNRVLIVSASAILWGCLHAAWGVLWFFGPCWGFFVFSCAYLVWRRVSFGHAFTAAVVPHSLNNLAVTLSSLVI